MKKLTAQQVAKAIKIPVKKWPGRCHEIACAMLKAGLVEGKDRYGHYFGPIADDCEKFGGRAFTHHGWIESGDKIIDPTRWVFENVDPYIYIGPKDDPDYDFGGNRLRKMMMKPCPPFDKAHKVYKLPDHLKAYCQLMIGTDRDEVSGAQAMWLANLPLDILDDRAEPLFRWIAEGVGLPGLIPMDNRMEILGK